MWKIAYFTELFDLNAPLHYPDQEYILNYLY